MPNARNNQPKDLAQKDKPRIQYIPPDQTAIVELARSACTQLGKQNPAFNDPEVVGGLASFLTFLSQKLATYASNGHKEVLPKNRLNVEKGTSYASQKETSPRH